MTKTRVRDKKTSNTQTSNNTQDWSEVKIIVPCITYNEYTTLLQIKNRRIYFTTEYLTWQIRKFFPVGIRAAVSTSPLARGYWILGPG